MPVPAPPLLHLLRELQNVASPRRCRSLARAPARTRAGAARHCLCAAGGARRAARRCVKAEGARAAAPRHRAPSAQGCRARAGIGRRLAVGSSSDVCQRRRDGCRARQGRTARAPRVRLFDAFARAGRGADCPGGGLQGTAGARCTGVCELYELVAYCAPPRCCWCRDRTRTRATKRWRRTTQMCVPIVWNTGVGACAHVIVFAVRSWGAEW